MMVKKKKEQPAAPAPAKQPEQKPEEKKETTETKVVDREFRVIGTMDHLLGPVGSPYGTIQPARSPGQTLLKLI